MPSTENRRGLFPALLKHWRHKRGLSQLDLAIAADVSSRHISFLETGRSAPSADMVLRLGSTLGIPLRQVNALLRAAGHPPYFAESGPAVPVNLRSVVDLLKDKAEPFPLFVMDRLYNIVDLNASARAVLAAIAPGLDRNTGWDLNLVRLTFDPEGAQPAIRNYDDVGRAVLWRITQEALTDPDDHELRDLVDEVHGFPTVADGWRESDPTVPASPAVELHVAAGQRELHFTALTTRFQAPRSVQTDELSIETWYPSDHDSEERCRALVSGADEAPGRAGATP